MMISPDAYITMHKEDSFEELIKERKRLQREITSLEKTLFGENQYDIEGWNIAPSPDVRYQMDLEYLASLCRFLSEKYNKKIVWADY